MRLTIWGLIALVLFAGWLGIALTIAYVDWKLRLEDRYRLEIRDWQEKVDAMRRLQDEDGEA
jgi:hypothetical protein